MRAWLMLGALSVAAVVVLGVGIKKYDASRGVFGAYRDEETGQLTVPGRPEPAPWLWAGGALGVLSVTGIALTIRRRHRES